MESYVSLVFLLLGLLLLDSPVMQIRTCFTQLLESAEILLLRGDCASFNAQRRLRHWDDFLQSVLSNIFKLGARGVSLLHAILSGPFGEHLQLRHVLFTL